MTAERENQKAGLKNIRFRMPCRTAAVRASVMVEETVMPESASDIMNRVISGFVTVRFLRDLSCRMKSWMTDPWEYMTFP